MMALAKCDVYNFCLQRTTPSHDMEDGHHCALDFLWVFYGQFGFLQGHLGKTSDFLLIFSGFDMELQGNHGIFYGFSIVNNGFDMEFQGEHWIFNFLFFFPNLRKTLDFLLILYDLHKEIERKHWIFLDFI